MPDATGLSAQGVELALAEHLETEAPDGLRALVAACGKAPRCIVVLASNVCTAAARAIAVAAATATHVEVRPSRRDPVLAEILVRELRGDAAFLAAAGSIDLVESVSPTAGDELHLYGSDETIQRIVGSLPPGVSVRAHGTGFGVAAVGAAIEVDEAARLLARDVIAFDQRGCLSPRFALVEGSRARLDAFAEALDRALDELGEAVPRGVLDATTQAELALYRRALEATGRFVSGRSHALGIDDDPVGLLLPPAARVVHVAGVGPRGAALVAPWAQWLTAIGTAGKPELAHTLCARAPHARTLELGKMQKPPLDGPVDLRASSARKVW
jgi:hypothetical protein